MTDTKQTGEDFVSELYEATEERLADVTDIIFDRFDDFFLADHFKTVDDDLERINIRCVHTTLLVALLAATLPAKDKLKQRAAFVERVEAHLKVAVPAKVEGLMKGLR